MDFYVYFILTEIWRIKNKIFSFLNLLPTVLGVRLIKLSPFNVINNKCSKVIVMRSFD